MNAAARLAWRDLSTHWRPALAMGSVFAIAVLAFATLGSYRRALAADYPPAGEGLLVAQQEQSFGEFYGSRLGPETEAELTSRGATVIAAETHSLVGTSLEDAVLLKGLDLDHYASIDRFTIIAGRPLLPGDSHRRAMIGSRLADRFGATPGGTIRLRGRDFEVVGVFTSGSYSENEAWVPLAGAQELLGWGADVSLFVVADDGALTPGQTALEGVSVARRGELLSTFPQTFEGLLDVMDAVTKAMGAAAGLFLASMLWRLAHRRQWQIAVLRSLGFPPSVFAVYLVVQGAVVALTGGAAGVVGAFALLRGVRPNVAGLSLRPQLSADLLLATLIWLGVLTLLGVAVPLWALGRRRVAELMRSD